MKKSNSMDDFEKRIQRLPPRPVPPEWREEILRNAHAVDRRAPDAARPGGLLSTLNHQLSTLLWPHPRAWAGLASLWILIFALKLSTRDERSIAGKISPVSPEVSAELRQQKLFFAELAGTTEGQAAPPSKLFLPRPRSARRDEQQAA
jgi:hypothetical protein